MNDSEELRKIVLDFIETDKSITRFRALQMAGREN